MDNQIIWKNHIQLLPRKLSSACFLLRRLYYILNIYSLKLVYFAHFHSVVKYGIIFWDNQHYVNKVFILHKRILRIMLGLGYRSSCRTWFKRSMFLSIFVVQCADLMTEKSWFDSWQELELLVFPFRASRPPLEPTQPLIQCWLQDH